MKVSIEPNAPATLSEPGQTIHLDGVDMSRAVRSYKLEQDAGSLPQLTLDGNITMVCYRGEARVWVSAATRELLEQLGWTPPEGHEEAQA